MLNFPDMPEIDCIIQRLNLHNLLIDKKWLEQFRYQTKKA